MTKKPTEITSLNLPIEMIAPSHGAIWRENPLQIVEKYVGRSGRMKKRLTVFVSLVEKISVFNFQSLIRKDRK